MDLSTIPDAELSSLYDEITSNNDAFFRRCSKKFLCRLVANYRATLSRRDQIIFLLISEHEEQGFLFRNCSPDFKIGAHYKATQTSKGNKESLQQETTEESNAVTNDGKGIKRKRKPASEFELFWRQFDRNVLRQTSVITPITLSLKKLHQPYDAHAYDPRFLLGAFYQHLVQSSVTFEEFISQGALAITLACLACECESMRRAAYAVLHVFSKCCNNDHGRLWQLILESLRCSINSEAQRVSSLLVSFLVHVCPLIDRPHCEAYPLLVKTLSEKPSLHSSQVPAFVRHLLQAQETGESTQKYQTLALRLLANGIRTTEDYRVCAHHKLIQLLLISYTSPLFAKALRPQVLDVFVAIARIPEAIKDLCAESAFLLWIHRLILTSDKDEAVLQKLNQILSLIEESSLGKQLYTNFEHELAITRSTCWNLLHLLL